MGDFYNAVIEERRLVRYRTDLPRTGRAVARRRGREQAGLIILTVDRAAMVDGLTRSGAERAKSGAPLSPLFEGAFHLCRCYEMDDCVSSAAAALCPAWPRCAPHRESPAYRSRIPAPPPD